MPDLALAWTVAAIHTQDPYTHASKQRLQCTASHNMEDLASEISIVS